MYMSSQVMPSIVHHDEGAPEGRIFLSNFGVAGNIAALHLLGITHVLNCTVDCPFAAFDQAALTECEERLEQALEDGEPTAIAYLEACLREHQIASQTEPAVGRQQMRVAVVDDADQHIDAHFVEAIKYIDSAMSAGGKVLVHCKHGQSRSATVLAAWFVAHQGMTVQEALAHLKRCRPRVGPNKGFVEQLYKFQDSQNQSH